MNFWDSWAHNGPIKLHFITNVAQVSPEAGLPLVIVPGTSESAEDYLDLLEILAPRPVFALSLRGRGQSGSPLLDYGKGGMYRLEDHASDVKALLDTLKLPGCCLMGYSRGVTYALAATLNQPDRVRGLILQDYPAFHSALPTSWIEQFLESTSRGMPISQKMMPHVVEGLQRDAADVDLWTRLPEISCPVLIMYGSQKGSRLPLADVERYLTLLPNARTARFSESGHQIWEPDYGLYVLTIAQFLERL